MKVVGGVGLIAASSRSTRSCRLWRPQSCDEAVDILASEGDAATSPVIVAGGTDLVAQFNEGLDPHALLSLDRIAELKSIERHAEELRIGSCVTHAAGSSHSLVCEHFPELAQAWRLIANVRLRFWATIGGNVMARRTRYEMPILLTALRAKLRFVRASNGAHETIELTPADIWAGRIPDRALLHHVALPCAGQRGFRYDRSLRPILTLAVGLDAVASCAVIATEWLKPVALALPQSERRATHAAAAAFAALPDDFSDIATSRWYLARAGETMLRRQLIEVGYARA